MDKNTGFQFTKRFISQGTLIKSIAITLIIIGVEVLTGWHKYHQLFNAHLLFDGMAFTTAGCFLLAGIGLIGLNLQKQLLPLICGGLILIISSLRLIEIGLNLDIYNSIDPPLITNADLSKSALMNPVTAFNFILIAIVLLVSRSCIAKKISPGAIVAMLISLLMIAITFIAFYDNAITKLISMAWFSIKIAPLTAVGFILFSCSIIILLHTTALQSFNRLKVFNRLAIGFGFICLLFIGMGSIALIQIHGMSVINKELHQNPLEINYAALRIKNEISQLNRKLKDIAINPDLIEGLDISNQLKTTRNSVHQEIRLIQLKEPTLGSELERLNSAFQKWSESILLSEKLLTDGDTTGFRERTLNDSQTDAIKMEALANNLIQEAQKHILALNKSLQETEANARQLLLTSLIGLLAMGFLVAALITRSLTSQLQQIRHAMLDIANGNTKVTIPFLDYQEEIGDMAKTLETFSKNITIRQRMEARMTNIIEATPNGIVMIDGNGLIEVFNQQAEKIFGLQRADILGKPVEQLIPQRMAIHHPQARQDFFKQPMPRSMGAGRELFGLRQDGSEFPLEIGLAPIETEEGTKVLASIVDISARKKAEQLLKRHQKELEQTNSRLAATNKELETFAYVASHDLKSPLRGIAQLSSWIEEDLAEKEFSNIDNHTSMLRNRIQRMEKLLDDLLIFYRAGKVDGALSSLNLNIMVKELFDIQNDKPGLHLEAGSNLPTITTLSTPFEQVIRNLFSNAIKHHDKANGTIQFIYRDINEDYYEFGVCDDGPGIPKQFQDRVFGMFQTLKPRDELEGSGMGLALIKKIVETYSGTISIHSEGRGCCFTFTWPKDIKRKTSND